jgi:nucleotide-binding universal stress UspA family protein
LPLAEYVAGEARIADLIVTAAEVSGLACDGTRQADPRDLVMRAGRPVLLVPPNAPARPFDRLLVAWKDSREAQRAISDALPLLRGAARVALVEIASEQESSEAPDRLEEVAAWLGKHGVRAEPHVVAPHGANATQLEAIAEEMNADLIVAGACGYSRRSTWVVGSVTAELLAVGKRCALLAH